MSVLVAAYELEWKPAGSWVALSDDAVVNISGGGETSQSDAGTGFGDTATTQATVEVLRTAISATTLTRIPVRFTFTIGASSARAFVGMLRSWSGDRESVTLECSGMLDDLPARTKDLYSPLYYRRPPATKTTAASIEDPTNGSYAAGLINWILWQAGGRPNEQSGSYPTAEFYYSCEQAIRAPDWSWVAGEDGWSECLRLARAVGGQLYQGQDGVIRYRQPLTMVGASVKTFTTDDYGDVRDEGGTDQYAATITCSFTPRRVHPTQEVISDTTYRVVAAGASVTIDLEPHWPLYSVVLDGGTLKERNITATRFDGQAMAYHATTGYTVVTTVKAMRVTLVVTNNSAFAMQISKIVISGQPIAAGETGTVTAGTGKPTRTLEDNIFVQTKAHAEALATMELSFRGAPRPVRTLTGCVWDPTLANGNTVALTDTALGLSATPHIIQRAAHDETGMGGEYSLVDATGLPALADYWLIQSTSQSGTKKIAW